MQPHKIDLDPIVNTWPSNDYYDDDETLKASVLQAGSLSSSVPPLSGIRHRPGDNQNVDYLGYLDYLVYLDHLGNNQNVDYLDYLDYLVYLDHLGSVVLVKGVREVMVVMVLIMMVHYIDENDVDSHEAKR